MLSQLDVDTLVKKMDLNNRSSVSAKRKNNVPDNMGNKRKVS